LVAGVYGKKVESIPEERVCIDRSLDSSRFRQATGYLPPAWPEFIK
jgi:dTDP-4-dehydrorhamnose reductase